MHDIDFFLKIIIIIDFYFSESFNIQVSDYFLI